ncbi:hypothetical protein L249_4163 [Ophiocordyceps polyrhachis-furcata BCC 54312]|uniref:UbiA prenyltransferase n=1 Tax=Ophiocordyceps polyrhachis-furcata BCC 54312 TaxID=1330021 RepID=A0A367L5E0_9HYPO|nr:hypothetical protein L249_4163 [Ophiocordyceps polyrhachis-furcata BCC 54312]
MQIPSYIWALTESDWATFAVPCSTFGLLAAPSLASSDPAPAFTQMLQRLPTVLVFNWSNLLCFNMANQRAPESVAEDGVNKPHRPLVTGLISSEGVRRAMFVSVPLTLALSHWLGTGQQAMAIHVLIWLYNDLKGMEDFVMREVLLAAAFALFNGGSLQLALGSQSRVGRTGLAWIAVVSGIILTTIQVQDLKDQAGDRLRGRKTVPLVLGERLSRGSIAVLVCVWSLVCGRFWALSATSTAMLLLLAGLVAWRVLARRGRREDLRNWHLWCVWLMCVYALPVIGC